MPSQSTKLTESTTEFKRRLRKKRRKQPRYHVILLDDAEHSYDYVVLMMKHLFRLPIETGFQIAREVDKESLRKSCVVIFTDVLKLRKIEICKPEQA